MVFYIVGQFFFVFTWIKYIGFSLRLVCIQRHRKEIQKSGKFDTAQNERVQHDRSRPDRNQRGGKFIHSMALSTGGENYCWTVANKYRRTTGMLLSIVFCLDDMFA